MTMLKCGDIPFFSPPSCTSQKAPNWWNQPYIRQALVLTYHTSMYVTLNVIPRQISHQGTIQFILSYVFSWQQVDRESLTSRQNSHANTQPSTETGQSSGRNHQGSRRSCPGRRRKPQPQHQRKLAPAVEDLCR